MQSRDLAGELRAHAPAADAELRRRVLAIPDARGAESGPLWTRRRLAVAALVACLLVGAAVAAAVTLVSTPRRGALQQPAQTAVRSATEGGGGATSDHAYAAPPPAARVAPKATLAPATPQRRLENVDAYLRLRVPNITSLSRTTKRAQALARDLGGYVRSVSYDAGGRSGSAEVALRVPAGRLQQAVAQLSGFGTVLSQHVQATDAQGGVDLLTRRIASLRRQAAALRAQLRDESLTRAARTALQLRLARVERELPALVRQRAQATAHARFSTVTLDLTVARRQVALPPGPSRFDRALHELARVLERELIVILYVLGIAAPFALAYAAARAVRRRGDRRLLA